MADLTINSAAEAEFEDALDWYRSRSARTADRFEAAFRDVVQSILANPLLYPLCDDRHRFCTLRRFPYVVVYRVDGDQIRVVAVAHSHRQPGYWSGRT